MEIKKKKKGVACTWCGSSHAKSAVPPERE